MGGFCGYVIKSEATFKAAKVSDFSRVIGTISRNPADFVVKTESENSGFCYFHIDNGRFDTDEYSCLLGDPLLVSDTKTYSRAEAAQMVLAALRRGDADGLNACRGSYSAFCHDEATGDLHLLVDKYGTRPVYYFDNDDLFAFSTCRRVLFELCGAFTSVDPVALGQQVFTRQKVGNNTLASEVKVLRGGERLHYRAGRPDVVRYYDIERTPKQDLPYEAAVDRVFAAFVEAVRRRVAGPRAYAMLSGGLDSRAVVAALRELDVDVQSFAIAKRGTPDARISPMIARQLGTRHRLVESTLMERVQSVPFMGYVKRYMPRPPSFPSTSEVWAGDGGSVLLGHVYMTERNTSLAASGEIEATVLDMFPALKPSTKGKALRTGHAETLRKEALASVCEEMAQARDDERRLFLFLLRNDQQRHLYGYLENIDIWRVNPILPFFDSDFVETVYSLPQSYFLKHRLYNDFIARFKLGADRIPWQVYRDHIPGPVQMEEGEDQWHYARIFEKEPREAHLAWTKAFWQLPLRNLRRYINPWFVRWWELRARLGLVDSPAGIRLISRFALLTGRFTDSSRYADLGSKATIRDS